MSNLLILTSKQKGELNKALIQYLEPLLSENDDNSDTLNKLASLLNVDTTSTDEVIPNYLEKKWSTVLRLQKKIMDLETNIESMKSAMESQAISSSMSELNISKDKINWIPSGIKQVFKTQSHQQILTVAIHPFLPIILCGCSDGTIIIWNLAVEDNIPEKIIKAHTRSVNCIKWSKGPIDIGTGQLEYLFVSSSSDLSMKVWHGSNYKLLRNLVGHEHTVSSIAFSSNDYKTLYSVSRDKTVKIWDIVDASCKRSFVGHSDWVRDIDVITLKNKDQVSVYGDFILTCSNDHSLRLSHAESGTGLALLIGHGHVVEKAKFLPLYSNKFIDKYLESNSTKFPSLSTSLINDPIYTDVLGFKYCISCGRDNSIKLWLLPPPNLKPHRPPLPSSVNNSQGWLIDNMVGHTSWVKSIIVHPNGRFLLSAGDDKTVRVWDLNTLVTEAKVRCIKTLSCHESFVNDIEFASFETNGELETTNDYDSLMKYIQSNMRCIFISGSVDNTVKLWH